MRSVVLIAGGMVPFAVGCQLVSDFTLTPVAEQTDELCSDGRDNDFDGLVDCQDWNCLDQLHCCDIPEVLLEDEFETGPACAAEACTQATCTEMTCGPQPSAWHAWPCPYAQVCDGALHINKSWCYPAGVLSRATMVVGPGLSVAVGLQHAPEQRGWLTAGLTLQDEHALAGSTDPCGVAQMVNSFLGLRVEAADNGYQVIANFQGRDLGTSAVVTDPDQIHVASFGVDSNWEAFFALDGVVFAVGDETVPINEERARLAIEGYTAQVTVTSVRVAAGLRCHSPASFTWEGGGEVPVVALASEGSAWDGDEVFHPSVRVAEDGTTELYYTGCRWASEQSGCGSVGTGIGRAHWQEGAFTRDAANPLIVPDDIPDQIMTSSTESMQVAALDGAGQLGYLATGDVSPIFRLEGFERAELVSTGIESSTGSTWDGGYVCCPTAVTVGGTTYLWYAATSDRHDPIFRIGLATSTNGVDFEPYAGNPVLVEGLRGTWNSSSVKNPTVVYDEARGLFLMWYEGLSFFNVASIGYAVSIDGAHWFPFPGNPVLTAAEVGLASIGGPEAVPASDGRLKLYVHGNTLSELRRRIYLLRNDGTPLEY